ncbi:hypothetical protein V2I84_05390 [Pseudomonas viridiflava]|uniref:hypothetical protein n=1 Tax=Pseudomonas viridiflava TaxID=33069 RepID=UPI002EC405E5|nr:hypothetical protein [Pseudomonas viridiflava]MEE3980888.1 hypothetical protein [Pseudomonas viridiflava]MEE3989622.1 hypothetical protein [Pseudomonas viridiflava]MEE4028168.1 hypothetical protein [Pseudomonas viridiflava]MEE4034332.1 hypothetical protein [Pseudomonas viridiflava]
MSNEFRREDRYIVIKNTDADKASPETRRAFSVACRKLHDSMLTRGAPARSFLVIESDWPEYEPTWAEIEARMTGEAPQPPALGGDPEILGYSVKGNRYAIRLTKGELLELYEGYKGDALIELIDRAHLAPLQAEIERLKVWAENYGKIEKVFHSEREIWNRESLANAKQSGKYRQERDQLKARCDELESERAKALDFLIHVKKCLRRNGEYSPLSHEELDGLIGHSPSNDCQCGWCALSKPAGSDTTITDFGPEHTWTCGTCQTEQPTDRACDVCNGSTEPAPRECCTPTTDEQAWLAAGDCTPEELWGGPRPTCPKCIGSVKP